MKRISQFLIIFFLAFSCHDDFNEFSICNRLILHCAGGNGDYCLFGYKWGDNNPFTTTGYNSTGPGTPAHNITYSFQESNGVVNTHSQEDIPSLSFNELPDCAKSEIRKALDDWAAVADISFAELPDNSNSDIRFYVANIKQSGVSFPNFLKNPCNLVSGEVVLNPDVKVLSCEDFYKLVLHETGHSLGLGHVNSENIMNANKFRNFNGIQDGDRQGVVEIYGEK